ncbi:Swi snf-related matrix-associated actin-dependent regulator of chromatin subfamily a member 3-like 1 [Neofusicoccum parvum]|uniref:Swi snf-related matrix-associated actin-dependent regulator of chromatin subfamily a member 3-like 1 n=1 Tax=Neofusicoccum parvum TaxID=310453 RepID=A0ACB5S3G2_9PEZI|nr:Swi snf-related matrix-associated actin-dependent regulator of chromatin subfamily a member 3-like 1 [Neofusicoccum parvum]
MSFRTGVLNIVIGSNKVTALVEDIQANIREKSVVFSYWTTSLNLVERAVKEANIGYVRFDGSVSSKNRELALHRLHHDLSVRVILITVSCGAVGLDLTAASRAYLLEPQWNPTTEEQALARIHRMGQERPVTTIRFIMRRSFEEHVMKVQDRKRELADLIFSGGRSSGAEQTQARLSVRNLPKVSTTFS